LTPKKKSVLMRFVGNQAMPRKGESTMTRSTVLALFAATLVSIGVANAHAQATDFNVPFAFIVGNQTMPTGTYRVSRDGFNELLIRSRDGGPAVFLLTSESPAPYEQTPGRLIFTRYGNQYFLHEVFCRNATMHAKIPPSRLETVAQIQEVKLRTSTQSVAVLQVPEQR